MRGRAFVVDGEGPPLACVRAVVDERDERRRDEVTDASREHRPVLLHEIGFEPVAARFVEQHSTRAALQHHRQFPCRCGSGAEHRERTLRRGARHRFGIDLVEELETDAASGRLEAGLHPGVGDRHAVHAESGAHGVVFDEQAVGVGDEDATTGIRVRDAHLADRVALRPRRVIGTLEDLGLASLLDRLREDEDVVRAFDVAPFERDDVLLARGAPRSGGGRGGRFREPVLAQIGGVRVTGGIASDHADPGATLPARDQLLDLGVIEPSGGHPTILREHLGEVTAIPQRSVQRALEHRSFDHVVTSVRGSPSKPVESRRQAHVHQGGCLS